MHILGTTMSMYGHPDVEIPLYSHQCALFDAWKEKKAFVLVTKTGSGKTAAVTLPVIHSKESAVFIYPTNALIADQERSILQLLQREGLTVKVLSPKNINEKSGGEDYHLIKIDAYILEEFRIALRMKDKSAALLRLMNPSRPIIILINPDLLYLIFSLKYGQSSSELIAHFQAYRTAVFDEFHLYSGVELAHALFMIHLIREFGGFSRVAILSATLSPEVYDLLNKLLTDPLIIDATAVTLHTNIGYRTTTHTLDFDCHSIGSDEVDTFFTYLNETRNELELARIANTDNDYVPAVIILNSVVSAIRLEDHLVEVGWSRNKIGNVRGLMAKSERQLTDKVVIIGTSAIEVGIDFKTDLLLFEAGDSASFMQRIGRLGRHGPGTAILFGHSREIAAFQSLPFEMNRDVFENTITRIYMERDTFSWFPSTFSGALTMIAQAESIRRKIEEVSKGEESAKAEVSAWLDTAIERFGIIMCWEKQLRQARTRVKKARIKTAVGQWIVDYINNVGFRSSIPTVEVYDWAEAKRGRRPEYDADLITLLKWGNRSPHYKDKTDTIYIDGFHSGRPHNVYLSATFEKGETGMMLTTSDYPLLKVLQDGHSTSVSHLFTLRPYLFILVPLDFARKLDWRLPWFRCGSQGNKAAVFDGAALIVWEMWKKYHYS
ncbi:MAG: type I-D CRISPR-associated helicase Cas3' [Bacillota bacterium]